MRIESNQTVSHYRLVEQIGRGGMGVVWKAEDSVLQRTVAIKFLPASVAIEEERRKMFLDEARLAASVSHGNIVQVHELGQVDDLDFIVMELVEGRALNEVLRSRRLSYEEIADLGLQLSTGLSRAHQRGLIHRDLKPANILVTPQGDLKIVDFGIATLFASDAATRTVAGTRPSSRGDTKGAGGPKLVGTVPYMSPEQLRGETLDARSDVFSFGIVLYEMVTGRRPFEGNSPEEIASAIMRGQLVPVQDLAPDVPLDLQRIIEKAMSLRPADRYQSVEEMTVDFRRLLKALETGSAPTYAALQGSTGTRKQTPFSKRLVWTVVTGAVAVVLMSLIVPRFWSGDQKLGSAGGEGSNGSVAVPDMPPGTHLDDRKMIVVLPFENLSPDPDQEFFSDGMTEEVIAQLAKLSPERLGVIARTSAMRYKESDPDIAELRRDLGVQYVLEGSVRHANDRVRITAQLIDASDLTHLWAENYEGEITDVFAIQGDVAGQVAQSLSLELLPAQKAELAKVATTVPAAHEAYLRGRFYWAKRTIPTLLKAVDYFREAVELDPSYAEGWWGVADGLAVLADYDYTIDYPDVIRQIREASQKALELDPNLIEARAPLCLAAVYEWDWATAEREIQYVIERRPGYATAHHWYSWVLVCTGRNERAVEQIRLARRLDPLSIIINSNVGQMLFYSGRYEEAVDEFSRCFELDSDFAVARNFYALTLAELGQLDEAISLLKELFERWKSPSTLAHLTRLYEKSGDLVRAREYLRQLEADSNADELDLALAYASLGQKESALRALEQGCTTNSPGMRFILLYRTRGDWEFLESSPRFQTVLRCVNLAP